LLSGGRRISATPWVWSLPPEWMMVAPFTTFYIATILWWIKILITTLSIHYFLILSLLAENLHSTQIHPTFYYPAYRLPSRIIGLDWNYRAHRFIFTSFFR